MNVTSAETSLEMIVAEQPDLIVTITEADYEKYSAIAPTVYIEDGKRSDEELFLYIWWEKRTKRRLMQMISIPA